MAFWLNAWKCWKRSISTSYMTSNSSWIVFRMWRFRPALDSAVSEITDRLIEETVKGKFSDGPFNAPAAVCWCYFVTDLRIIKGFTGYDFSAVQLLEHTLSAYTKPQASWRNLNFRWRFNWSATLCLQLQTNAVGRTHCFHSNSYKRLTSEGFFLTFYNNKLSKMCD